MKESIDIGDILEQTAFMLTPRETGVSVYCEACEVVGLRVADVMDRIERDGFQGVPQNPGAATYEKRLTAEDVWIRWDEPAATLDRLVRAVSPSLMPRFRFRGGPVCIARMEYNAEPVDAAPGTVLENQPDVHVTTGQGSVKILLAFAVSGFRSFCLYRGTDLRLGRNSSSGECSDTPAFAEEDRHYITGAP